MHSPRRHADATSVWPLGWGPQTPAVGRGCPRARQPCWLDRPVGPGVRTCPLWRAAAVVGVHAVHAGASVLAVVSGTVVDVLLTVLAGEACRREEPGVWSGPARGVGWHGPAPAPSWLDPWSPALDGVLPFRGPPWAAHRLGALRVQALCPALPAPHVTRPHTAEPTGARFLSEEPLCPGPAEQMGFGNAGLWKFSWKQPSVTEFPAAAVAGGLPPDQVLGGLPRCPVGPPHTLHVRGLPWDWGGHQTEMQEAVHTRGPQLPGNRGAVPPTGANPAALPPCLSAITGSTPTGSIINQERCAGR